MTDRDDLPAPLRPPLAPLAALLLESSLPARVAWVSPAGAPRVVPLWHHWSGSRLELATFVGSTKLDELADGAEVAVTIDTAEFPYRSLKLAGPVEVRPVVGLAPCYLEAAARYLGPTTAVRWLRSLDGRDQVVLAVRPRWATLSDMAASPFVRADLEGLR